MGLFEKKICSICGGEIGLLGSRKLADGIICKKCADKLSPLFDDCRQSTVDDIRDQLAYRKENAMRIPEIRPEKVFGAKCKLYVDEDLRVFFVCENSDWRSSNPDLISFDQVLGCRWQTVEHKQEIYGRTPDGKRFSYNPPKFEYEYEFDIAITVDSPYFQEIKMELTDQRPVLPFGPEYKEMEMTCQEICSILTRKVSSSVAENVDVPASSTTETWQCSGCGRTNNTNFCPDCGQKRPESIRCQKCGWQPDPGMTKPKFCPNCGNRFPD